MQQETVDAQAIKKNGWKQGACLLVNGSTKIHIATQCGKEQLPVGLYIVLSQDCDILNSDLEKEPVVELIEAKNIPQCDTKLTTGKNPRKLHLEINEKDNYLEVFPHRRHFINRNYLAQYKTAEIKLTSRSLKILISWLAKRYKRPGFPDTFNRRISRKRDQIQIILGEQAKDTDGLFVQLHSEEELAEDEAYKILLILLVPKDIYENGSLLQNIREGFDKIISLLDSINGIEIISGSRVESRGIITVHEYLQLKQWDFDYISFLNGEDGEIVGSLPNAISVY